MDAHEPADPDRDADYYDVYLGYDQVDAARAAVIGARLRWLDEIRAFDHEESVPGESWITTLGSGLERSRSLAILVGRQSVTNLLQEQARQAVRRAIDDAATRVFWVFLPGYEDGTDLPQEWLNARTPVDLRDAFDGDDLLPDGLAQLYAGVRGLSVRDARVFVEERLPHLRALLVTVGTYAFDAYPSLTAVVDRDRGAVEGHLRGTDGQSWEITRASPGSADELDAACSEFFMGGRPDDTLLFYFSGHGDVTNGMSHLIVTGTDPERLLRTAFPLPSLADWARRSASKRKIVVLDCCYSRPSDSTATDWGDHVAVFSASRQWTPAGGKVSELTRAFLDAWARAPATVGELADLLARGEFVDSSGFDRTIPLPVPAGKPVAPVPVQKPAARLAVDKDGKLQVTVMPDGRFSRCTSIVEALGARRSLSASLIDMIDTVMSLLPPEQIPIREVTAALEALGSDLLRSTLTEDIRSDLEGAFDTWDELRLEISFDDSLHEREAWEQVPWEALSLCMDDRRRVALERIVRRKDVKAGPSRRPERVIAWNALHEEPLGNYAKTGAQHILTHMLRSELAEGSGIDLHVVEPATWSNLFDATENGRLTVSDGAGAVRDRPIDTFDTFVLFDLLSLTDGGPGLWLNHEEVIEATLVVERLKKWRFSQVVIETVTGEVGSAATGAQRALRATTQLAAYLARELQVPVVAVCHSREFLKRARRRGPDDGEPFQHSFTGVLLRRLAGGANLFDAAREARRVMEQGLLLSGIHVGLPIVCRPDSGAAPGGSGGGATLPSRRDDTIGRRAGDRDRAGSAPSVPSDGFVRSGRRP